MVDLAQIIKSNNIITDLLDQETRVKQNLWKRGHTDTSYPIDLSTINKDGSFKLNLERIPIYHKFRAPRHQ